ncbi:UNVERIFIED_CONTAM: hypothetical protein FKN15_063838 [Acipenser sinensis]
MGLEEFLPVDSTIAALGRSLIGLIVGRRQLWLSRARVPEVCLARRAYLPWPCIRTSSGGDPAMLPPKTGSVPTGRLDAPFPCSGVGEDETLVSARDTNCDPDSSNPHCDAWRSEALPSGLHGS